MHATNYHSNKKVGKSLTSLMRPGATKDWRKLIKETTGSKISVQLMLGYVAPLLMEWLKKENKDRECTLSKEPAI